MPSRLGVDADVLTQPRRAARWTLFSEPPRVAVLAVADATGRPPLATPVWVLPDPASNRLTITTEKRMRKLALMATTRQASLCVHDDASPYRYVTVEGDIDRIEPALRRLRERPARRYLLGDLAAAYLTSTDATAAQLVAVHITPRRWHSVDYGQIVATVDVTSANPTTPA